MSFNIYYNINSQGTKTVSRSATNACAYLMYGVTHQILSLCFSSVISLLHLKLLPAFRKKVGFSNYQNWSSFGVTAYYMF